MADGNKWVDPKPGKILNDLQALRAEIAASVGGDPSNLGQRIAAMVGEKLTTVRASTQASNISRDTVQWVSL